MNDLTRLRLTQAINALDRIAQDIDHLRPLLVDLSTDEPAATVDDYIDGVRETVYVGAEASRLAEQAWPWWHEPIPDNDD